MYGSCPQCGALIAISGVEEYGAGYHEVIPDGERVWQNIEAHLRESPGCRREQG